MLRPPHKYLEYPAIYLEYYAMPSVLRHADFFGNTKGRVAVYRQPRQRQMGQHGHDFFEIAVVLSGTAVHVTGNFRHTIETGHVLVINSRRTHGYENPKGLNLINILIRDDLLSRIGRGMRNLSGYHSLFMRESVRWRSHPYANYVHLPASDLELIDDWASRLETETRNESQGGMILAEAYLTLIIGLLARRHRTSPGRTSSAGPLGRTLSWIDGNLDKPLRVADMARHASMTERSFHRAFRQTTQQSPVEYLKDSRIQRAVELLSDRSTPIRISEVAAQCGFSDSNYFTFCFHKAKGLSPRAFRRKEGDRFALSRKAR